jgi:hypothetical protein
VNKLCQEHKPDDPLYNVVQSLSDGFNINTGSPIQLSKEKPWITNSGKLDEGYFSRMFKELDNWEIPECSQNSPSQPPHPTPVTRTNNHKHSRSPATTTICLEGNVFSVVNNMDGSHNVAVNQKRPVRPRSENPKHTTITLPKQNELSPSISDISITSQVIYENEASQDVVNLDDS